MSLLCFVCGKDFAGMSEEQTNFHVNSCLDRSQGTQIVVCPYCTTNLSFYDIADREQHTLQCGKDVECDALFETSLAEKRYEQLQSDCDGSVCFVCDVSLKGKNQKQVTKHLSFCLGISVQQVESIFKDTKSNKKTQYLSDRLQETVDKIDSEIDALLEAKRKLQLKLERSLVLEGRIRKVFSFKKIPNLTKNHQNACNNINVFSIRKPRPSKFSSLHSHSVVEIARQGTSEKLQIQPDLKRPKVDSLEQEDIMQSKERPDFISMTKERLAKVMEENGLKKRSRRKMISELSQIWEALHPEAVQANQCSVYSFLFNFFWDQTKLMEDILLNRTLNLNEVLDCIKKTGIKCSKRVLQCYLDEQGVNYATPWKGM